MTPQETRAALEEIIMDVAPDADVHAVGDTANFREVLGLDSMDFLTIVERIAEQMGVEIPEAEYTKVETLVGLTDFVVGHV